MKNPNDIGLRVAMILCGGGLLALLTGCGSTAASVSSPILEGSEIKQTKATITPIDALNSPQDDFGATMPLDTTFIFFSSSRNGTIGPHSLFQSRMAGATWGTPTLAVELNNAHSNGTASITPGGESIYFAGHEFGFGDCDLYRADIGPRGAIAQEIVPWSIPTNLGFQVNGSYWDSQPCISADGSVLYFSSNRPGGFGNRDIWACRRKRDGTWDSPINAGELINTPFDEVSPWLAPDGQTLFFSSNGHPGIGGFDVFSAATISGVTAVTHLGAPINSTADEICFSLSADGRRAFLSSNRSGGKGGYDLYSVFPVPTTVDPLMVVRGSVIGGEGKPMVATVEVTDLTSETALGSFATDPETGKYTLVLPRGVNYAITAEASGYLFNSRQIVVARDLERDSSRTLDFTLQPINGVIRLLVFFKSNESNLQKESTNDLDRAVRFMNANPDISVEIAGHTDNTGDAQAALMLSKQRAQAVKSYLVGNRIKAERITVSGYGSAQPISSNDTEEGRTMNRRVEMRVIAPK
ncbi:MAG: OmpA family protein [Candidatus Kapaibacterium sp.]